MKRIRLLDPLIANQIAAGEVVERPASIVKELLENSVDSESTRIQVDIELGGLQLIRVRDDGIGIVKEDLPLALSRHATSKIRYMKDLNAVITLGFRGEALASIASVSRLTLMSMAQGDDKAWKVHVEGIAAHPHIEPASHPRGTTVEVRDIFYNAPVRRKFLRSEKTEYLHIEEVIKRAALSRFDVSFLLRHNQRLALNLRAATTEEEMDKRISDVCGVGFIRNALKVEFEHLGVKLWGWIAHANYSHSQNDLQYFYVNGRMVKDRFLNHAVRTGFESNIFEGRYPCYVLYLELNAEKVDVNVHPTKAEVRFQEGRFIHDFIVQSVKKTLNHEVTNVPLQEPKQKAVEYANQSFLPQGQPLHVAETLAVYEALKPTLEISFMKEIPQEKQKPAASISHYHYLGEPLLELWGEFILTKSLEGYQVISIPLARERIVYGTLLQALQDKPLTGQPLLFPTRITLAEMAIEAILTANALFEKLGIMVDALGPTTLVVKQLPAVLKNSDCEKVFPKLAQTLISLNPIKEKDYSHIIMCLAKSTVGKQINTYTKESMEQLLKDLSRVESQISLNDLPEARKPLTKEVLGKLFRHIPA